MNESNLAAKAAETPPSARDLVENAIVVLEEYGKKLSLRDVLRILLALPLSLWLVAVGAAGSIATVAFSVGKWYETSGAEKLRSERESPDAVVLDESRTVYPSREKQLLDQALAAEIGQVALPQNEQPAVVRIETVPARHPTTRFTMRLTPSNGAIYTVFAVRYHQIDTSSEPLLQQLQTRLVQGAAEIIVTPLERSDKVVAYVGVRLPGDVRFQPQKFFQVEVQ